MPYRALVLYSGTKSVERALRRVWPDILITSVDISPDYSPDFCVDVTEWDFYRDLAPLGQFDLVWASPPCTQYSRARQSSRDLCSADTCVQAAFNIIDYLQPACFFVENPASGLLTKRPFMAPYAPYKKHCTYCRYGTDYRKATFIWTNTNVCLKTCGPDDPCDNFRRLGHHPVSAQKGPSRLASGHRAQGCPTSTLWHVPERLVFDLCLASGLHVPDDSPALFPAP